MGSVVKILDFFNVRAFRNVAGKCWRFNALFLICFCAFALSLWGTKALVSRVNDNGLLNKSSHGSSFIKAAMADVVVETMAKDDPVPPFVEPALVQDVSAAPTSAGQEIMGPSVMREQDGTLAHSASAARSSRSSRLYDDRERELSVQAVLGPKKQIVIASGIDAKITDLKVDVGDKFKKGQVLVRYDCSVDYGRLKEAESRLRVTEKQKGAYEKLLDLQSASTMEMLVAEENHEQNKALVAQIKARLTACSHVAPFSGRVMQKMANQYEYVQTGRVLMAVSSLDPLRAELLVPSRWLRWLNVGTPLQIYVGETDRTYEAKIVTIYGEVDPVSRSIQVVAEMEKYHEELLPGMSGKAIFMPETVSEGIKKGFLGLSVISEE